MASRKQVLYPLPIVRKEQIFEIVGAPTAEDRLFRFLQFTRWLENSTNRPWKRPLEGIGTEIFYGPSGLNLSIAHRRLSKANRTWARFGHIVIRKLKSDRDEYQQRLDLNTVRIVTPSRSSHFSAHVARNQPSQRSTLTTIPSDQCRYRTLLCDIQDSDKPDYMNFVCQVVSIAKTTSGETILRIWDGTPHRFRSFHPRRMFVHDRSAVPSFHIPPTEWLTSIPDNYVADIICCGNWATAALSLKCGQIVFVRNVHLFWPANAPTSVPRKLCLRGGNANGRGIYFLSPAMSRPFVRTLETRGRAFANDAPCRQPTVPSANIASTNAPIAHMTFYESVLRSTRSEISNFGSTADRNAETLIEDTSDDSFFLSSF